jgi:hypothetical protein
MSRMKLRAIALSSVVAIAACDRGVHPPATPATPVATAPVTPPGPTLLTSADVDAKVRAEWTKAGVTPTPAADDATWLRRAWLDVLGTVPPPEVVLRFLADTGKDRRARAVEAMLASPLWADHWTDYWDDVWMGRTTRAPIVDRGAFRAWLHAAMEKNEAWNTLVTELLTATGVNSEGGRVKDAYMADGKAAPAAGINGAVNWTLRYAETPQDMAGTASRTLLGVQIQCAQCHDHKTEKWKQTDFQAFAAAFTRTRFVPLDGGKAMGQIKRIEVRDLDHPAPRFSGKMANVADLDPIIKAQPTALDGTSFGGGDGVRGALAKWVTSPDNPWFARAFVNRMWGHFLGRGFVDPVDDLRPSNAPAAPAVLDALAADFVASGFDPKHLVRVIVGSEAYGLSAVPLDAASAKVDPETKLWERFRVTPMGPDEMLAALVSATRLDSVVRATGRLDLDQIRFKVKNYYGFLFDVDEESDAPDFEGTISQALQLLNGSVVGTGARVLPGSAVADVMAAPGDDASKIEALYVRTLSRMPTADETAAWQQFLAASVAAPPDAPATPPPPAAPQASKTAKGGKKKQPDPLGNLENRRTTPGENPRVRAFEDILWTLLNSSEFVLNH